MRRYYKYYSENNSLEMARYRVDKIRRFYIHLLIYAIGVIIYVLKTYYGVPLNFPPLHYIGFTFMAIWTFIIVAKGMGLLVRETVFGDKWEERKVQEFMGEEQKTKWE